MQFTRPVKPAPADTFASYETASRWTRTALGVERLTRSQAADVRSAVARRDARAERKQSADPLVGLMERLRRRIEARAEGLIRPLLREFYRGYSFADLSVSVGPPRVDVRTTTKWVSGRGGFGHVTDGQRTWVNVMPGWDRATDRLGYAVLDGLLITHIEEAAAATGGIEVCRASWVRQGRGYDLHAESGHLAFHPATGTGYHLAGGDPARAARGLGRKLESLAVPADVRESRAACRAERRRQRRAAQLDRLYDRLSRWDLSEIGHVEVCRADSLRAGNCEPGTDQFIGRFFAGRDSATVGEIAAAVGRVDPSRLSPDDLTLARQIAAACLVAVRRDRHASRVLSRA